MADRLEVLFGADASELFAVTEESANRLRAIGAAAKDGGSGAEGAFGGFIDKLKEGLEGIEGIKKSLEGFAALAAAAFSVHEIEDFVESITNLGLQTQRAMEILGVSAGEVGTLSLVAKASGTSIEALEMQFARMSRNLVSGSKEAAEAAAFFGINVQQFLGESTINQLKTLADAYSAIPAGAERTANAQMLIGRGAVQMAELLSKGSAGIAEMAEMAQRAGISLDQLLGKTEETHIATVELEASFTGLGLAIYDKFSSVIDGAVLMLTHWVEALTQAIKGHGLVAESLQALADVLRLVETAVAAVVTDFEMLANVLTLVLGVSESVGKMFVDLVNDALKPVAEILKDIETGFSDLASMDFSGAAAAFTSALAVHTDVFGDMRRDGEAAISAIKAHWDEYTAAQRASIANFVAEYHKINDELDKQPEATNKTSEAAARLRAEWEKIVGSMKDSGSALDKINEQINTLTNALKGIPTMGGGAELAPEAAGKVRDLSSITVESAGKFADAIKKAADVAGISADVFARQIYQESGFRPEAVSPAGARGIAQFMPATAAQYGVDTSDPFSSLEGAGRYMRDLMQHFNGDVALALAAYNAGETRIKRDLETGKAFPAETQAYVASILGTRGKPTATTPEDVALTERDLAALKEKADLLEKGTLREQAEAEAIKAQLAGHGDVIKAKESEIAADQKMIASETDLEKKRKEQNQLEKDTLELKKLQTSAREAELKGAEGAAKGDPAAEFKAATALADLKISQAKELYGVDSAQYKTALNEKASAERTYTEQTRALTKERIDEDIRAAQDSANEQRKALDDALSHKRITAAQYQASTNAVTETEIASVRKMYEQEAALAGTSAQERLATENKLADEVRRLHEKETDDARKAADAQAKAYEGMANDIVGVFTTAVKGMVTGHETFRQAMIKALDQMLDKFIDMVGKMVAKWLAGELAQTAATTSGVAARTAASTAGAAAGSAGQAATILKSISSSAGEAFAGVFGFLSPVMGPAAAGPAAAAEGTVLATGGAMVAADIGMWRVPQDTLALVHRSELVMPAAQADAFRAMLSGSSPVGGGGGAGVSIHPSLNMHVSALDGDSTKQFMRNNQRQIMQSLHAAVRSGAHLGLKALT